MTYTPKANKKLGQHFLNDPNVITKITNNFKDECDVIIEVGPGPAILTVNLSEHEKPFYVIEKDTRFEKQLRDCVKEENLHFQDALQFDWPKFIVDNQLEDKKIWLVSNLPYNISVPLLMGFMKVPQIQYLSLMFQKEVGDKTFWRDGEKNQMGSLLSLSMNYFDTKKLMSVNPACFSPPPKVDSIVVSFTRKADPEISLEEFKEFEIFLRATFQQKRKQLGSVLKTLIHKDKKDQFFEDANVLPTIRAEGLKLKDIYSLYQSFKSL